MDSKRSPWLFIPTLYFLQGLPYIIINNFSTVMLDSLGYDKALIGLTSIIALPWSLKPLWAPLVESYGSTRRWILWMQLALAISIGAMSLAINMPTHIFLMGLFIIGAAFSATSDVATDGYYLHALDKGNQAFFSGIRNTFWRVANIFAFGILVFIAGEINSGASDNHLGWTVSLVIAAVIFFLIFLYHSFILPKPETDFPKKTKMDKVPYFVIFKEYLTQKRILVIIAFILTYRLGEGLLVKMAPLFLKDPVSAGGMGVSESGIGIMYGTVGVAALIIGGILGGWILKHFSLKKLLFPMALAMNAPNLFYVYLSYARPVIEWTWDLSFISSLFGGGEYVFSFNPALQLCVIIEQFGYGFGFAAFMVYLIYISRGSYRTSFYAISTGFMAIGLLIPGAISGFLQEAYGYQGLFTLSFLLAVPGMALLFFLPHHEE